MLTTSDVKQIIGAIRVAYPNYKPDDVQMVVDMYKSVFNQFTAKQVEAAVKAYIITDRSGFAPSIGQIIDLIYRNDGKNEELSEMEAWSLVSKALRNGTYGSEAEFEKLPPVVQKAVGSPHQLYTWATDEDYNESVVSSNFMRSYRICLERQKEEAKIPDYIKGFFVTGEDVKKIEDKE